MPVPSIRLDAGVDLDTQRLLAEGQLDAIENQRALAQNASVRLADLTKRYQAALDEMAKARAQALAAMAQAKEAGAQAQAAIDSAKAALEAVLTAAEHANGVAADAKKSADSMKGGPDADALAAAVQEAEHLASDARRLQDEAKELVRQLAALPVPLPVDGDMVRRIQKLFGQDPALTQNFTDPQQPGAAPSATLQVLPHQGEADVAGVEPLGGDVGPLQAELLARLDGVPIPAELQGRVDQVLAALASIDALAAQGLRAQAQAMRQGWQPIVDALLRDLGVGAATATPTTPSGPGAPPNTPTPAPTSTSTPGQPDFLPANAYFNGHFDPPPPGGWFFGVGDQGRTGQDSIYEWLPRLVEARAAASTHGHYLLAGSDEVTTVERHLHDVALYEVAQPFTYSDDGGGGTGTRLAYLSREEAVAALQEQGKTPAEIEAHLEEHERFLLALGVSNSESGDTPPMYGGRADYLPAIGLGAGVPLDLQISFNNSGSGEGDAWLDHSHPNGDVASRGSVERAYAAVVDDNLAASWVQIGDIGPLGDDIGKMLGDIYGKYGADTPEKQEAIRSVLFRYDERFGILANREFIAAAVETNNARRQGFFEGPVGRAILTVAASFIPVAGTYVAMMLNAGFTLHDGGSMSDALRAAAISYIGNSFGAEFGTWVSSTFGSTLTPAMAAALNGAATQFGTAAVRQILTDGRLDGRGLLAAALSGGAGGFMTSFTADSDFGRTCERFFGDDRAARIVGNLSSSLVVNGGHLSPADLLAALGMAAAPGAPADGDPWLHSEDGTDILVVEGEGGTTIVMRRGDEAITMNPDGTFTRSVLGPDGEPILQPYDPTGNVDPLPPGAGPTAPSEVWTGLRSQLNLDVSEPQWAELGRYVDLEGFSGGELLVRRTLADGTEWEVHVVGDENGPTSMHVEQLRPGTLSWLARRDDLGIDATDEQLKKLWDRLDDIDAFGGTMTLFLDDGSEWQVTGSIAGGEVNVDIARVPGSDPDNFGAMGTPELYDALERELAGLREDDRERLLSLREDQRDQALADLPRLRALVDVLREREAQNPGTYPDQVSRSQQNGAAASTAGGPVQVTTGNHNAPPVRSGVDADPWDRLTPEQLARMGEVDRYAPAGSITLGAAGFVSMDIPIPGDLQLHYNIPHYLSYVFGNQLSKRGVELWEWFEGHEFMGALHTDATDIAAGYLGILGLPNLPATTRPEMYPTLDAFFDAYPQLRGARADSPAVRDFLARWIPNLPLTAEQRRIREFIQRNSG